MTSCDHNCSSCSSKSSCSDPKSFLANAPKSSNIKKIIAVASGKGGVGKSSVTSLLAVGMQRLGKKCAILDADITGPSIPNIFGVDEELVGDEFGMVPSKTEAGTKIVSLNLILEDKTAPAVWRGPMIAGVVKQFYSDVHWGDIDYMFVDMPPGTGDVPLTVFQSLPVDGVIVVTSPQQLVSMVVEKALNMANTMNIPIIGIVENMSGFVCDGCGKHHTIYSGVGAEHLAQKFRVPFLVKLPLDPALSTLCDTGNIEGFNGEYIRELTNILVKMI